MTSYDPQVAEALDRLVPKLDGDAETMLRRARARRSRAHRRATRLLEVGIAALILTSGAAVAADRFDWSPWLHRDELGGTFSVDVSRRYQGPVPPAVRCIDTSGGTFTCSATRPARSPGVYVISSRVTAYQPVSRADVRLAINLAESQHVLSRARAQRLRTDLRAVPDEFFTKLGAWAVLSGYTTFVSDPGRPAHVLVPPTGVPAAITCEAVRARLECYDLARSAAVPVGSPIYTLMPADDWLSRSAADVSARWDAQRSRHGEIERAVFGRDLTPAERRIYAAFSLLPIELKAIG